MALKYKSSRFTKDIDFSTSMHFREFDKDVFIEEFISNLAQAQEELEYNLDCRLQRHKIKPNEFGNFQTLEMKIGYAYFRTNKHRHLMNKKCPDVLEIDYSFNEITGELDDIDIGGGAYIKAYNEIELIAEKLRAMLQQEKRNRYRRQDSYDLFRLLEKFPVSAKSKKKILSSLIEKCESRNIFPTKDLISDPEIKARSGRDYDQIKNEITEDLPPFEKVYGFVESFYKSLPWETEINKQ